METKLNDLLEFFSENPHRWCQFTRAKNFNGIPVSVDDYGAVQWCLEGGIDYLRLGFKDIQYLERAASKIIADDDKLKKIHGSYHYGCPPISFVNDDTNFTTVIKLIKDAIDLMNLEKEINT